MTAPTEPDVPAAPPTPPPREGPEEFEALLMPLLGSAFNTAYRLTRNPNEAEDLVQEAVLLACRGFGTFEPGSNFKAWFFRILTNAYFSKYRQRRRRGATVELEDTPELYLYLQTASIGLHTRSPDPAEALMARVDAETVGAALAELPDEYRAVATLYFVNDLGYHEIATTLGIPGGTVRSRLHRARRQLQRALWRLAEDRGIVAALKTEPS